MLSKPKLVSHHYFKKIKIKKVISQKEIALNKAIVNLIMILIMIMLMHIRIKMLKISQCVLKNHKKSLKKENK